MATATAENEVRDIISGFITKWHECALVGKDQVKSKWNHFCDDFGLDDSVLFIRPSGNPATPSLMLDMLLSGDVVPKSSSLMSVDSVRIFAAGHAAVVTFTQHTAFNYKGKDNDDIAKWTMVLEKSDETAACWKVVHAHRGTGQPPAAAQPNVPGQ